MFIRMYILLQYLISFMLDHYAKASPACKRAVLETVKALEKEGHECIEFDVPGGESSLRF